MGSDGVWDVVVVGAGPAGAAAALAALRRRPDARVLLLDRAGFPRDKACGDGVAAAALDVAAALGVTGTCLTAGSAPVSGLELRGATGRVVRRHMRRPAYVVPRVDLDARLVAAAVKGGAVLHRHRVREVTPRPGRGLVDVDGTFAGRVVVGADGVHSVVRRAAGAAPNPAGHVAVALRGYASVDPGAGVQVLAMARERWPAYAWSFPVGDGRANVGYGEVLTGAALSREQLLDRLARLLPHAAAATRLRAAHLPLSTRRPPVAHGRLLLAGDAASLVNPLTGEGIFYAVLSGALAGAAALDGPAAGAAYAAALRRALGGHLRLTTATARLTARPGGHRLVDGALAAAGRSQRAFDALVDLGLGPPPARFGDAWAG